MVRIKKNTYDIWCHCIIKYNKKKAQKEKYNYSIYEHCLLHFKKNINNETAIEHYMLSILNKCESQAPVIKKPAKINDEKISIPTTQNYNDIMLYNYNLAQLKTFAKHYKLKLSGNKNQLVIRVYSFLYFSSYIVKIQKLYRGNLARKYKNLRGPASMNRKLCTNSSDFITLEPIEEIRFNQFFSYEDSDGFIYGFDIASLYSLIFINNSNKSGDINSSQNPYNRNKIPDSVLTNIKYIVRMSRILKIYINLHVEDDTPSISNEKAVELRALSLFQNIDSLGNYSNPKWFNSLNRSQLIRFSRELHDIWRYRAQLTNETKHNICPTQGGPFRNLNMHYVNNEANMANVRKVILEVMENMILNGVDRDSKTLGSYFVLGALTVVSSDAAASLPWLFQSFSHL